MPSQIAIDQPFAANDGYAAVPVVAGRAVNSPSQAQSGHLDESRTQIVAYYQARVIESPPDSLLGQSLNGEISEESAKRWLNGELDRVFPSAESLIHEMKLDERYKDVTFETLNREDFLESVKEAFPNVDWDKAYTEFKAAGQSEIKG